MLFVCNIVYNVYFAYVIIRRVLLTLVRDLWRVPFCEPILSETTTTMAANFRKIDIDQYDEDVLNEEELYEPDPRDPSQVLADTKQKASAVRGYLSKCVSKFVSPNHSGLIYLDKIEEISLGLLILLSMGHHTVQMSKKRRWVHPQLVCRHSFSRHWYGSDIESESTDPCIDLKQHESYRDTRHRQSLAPRCSRYADEIPLQRYGFAWLGRREWECIAWLA